MHRGLLRWVSSTSRVLLDSASWWLTIIKRFHCRGQCSSWPLKFMPCDCGGREKEFKIKYVSVIKGYIHPREWNCSVVALVGDLVRLPATWCWPIDFTIWSLRVGGQVQEVRYVLLWIFLGCFLYFMSSLWNLGVVSSLLANGFRCSGVS